MTPSVGLLISTYNWPAALRACLQRVAAQSILPDEVIVADDGSGPETTAVIAEFAQLPLVHVWHADTGFRLAEIRNKGIAVARSDYLVVIDGDMLIHRDFIADHRALLLPNSFRQGSRIPLSQALSQRVLSGAVSEPGWLHSGVKRRWKKLRALWLSRLLARASTDPLSVRGCHQAFWRADLLAVNGYNGDIQGWGREDNELAARLIHAGVRRRDLRQAAVAYHLWHAERSREAVSANEAILNATLATRATRCAHGLDGILSQGAQWIVRDQRPPRSAGAG